MSQDVERDGIPAEVLRVLGETARVARSVATMRMSLNADDAIEINGRKLRADATKAYIDCVLSHSFPVVTIGNTAIHPNTVAASWKSMEGQPFDLNHFVKAYDPARITRDRILGSVMEVSFPPTPEGGWRIPASKEDAPGIRAVASAAKMAEGMEEIISQHTTGRLTWAVSMENWYLPDESGFLISRKGEKDAKDLKESWITGTPDDITAHGYVYVPMPSAPGSMLDCLDLKNSEITQNWAGREVILLIGGLGSVIHYHGIGITPKGREVEAVIVSMAASAEPEFLRAECGALEASIEVARSLAEIKGA